MKKFRLVMSVALAALLVPMLKAKAQQQAPQPEPQTNSVIVMGEVATPGVYELKPTEGVPEAIARAGGARPEAALTQVTVRRNATNITINMFPTLRQNGAKPDFVLHDGDVVDVPRNSRRVYVVGEVISPGSFIIPENGTLSGAEALALAGGLRSKRTATTIILLRQTANGKFEKRAVLTDVTDPKLHEPLQSGDAIGVTKSVNRFGPRQASPNAYLWLLESH